MKTILEYLLGKTKNSKIIPDTVETQRDILIAAFLHVMINHFFKETSTFKRDIYFSKIKYNMILRILNEFFNYNFSEEDINKNGMIYDCLKNHKAELKWLVNKYSFTLEHEGEKLHINTKEIWEKYKDYIYRQKLLLP